MIEDYITPKEQKLPEADVFLQQDTATGMNFWIIEKCPYCGNRHKHHAGNDNDDPKDYLGHQKSLCTKRYPADRGYMLIEK